MNVGHRIADGVRGVVAFWTPVPHISSFIEKGTLTPDEFVAAGDYLAYKFPTWKWESTEKRRRVSWLPPKKQFLISRNVPCRSRVKELDYMLEQVTVDPEGGWCLAGEKDDEPPEDILDIGHDIQAESCAAHLIDKKISPPNASATQDEEEIDIELLSGVDIVMPVEDDAAAANDGAEAALPYIPKAGIVPTRTYDITITYDKYYQTPRLWLFGYDEYGVPLKTEQIFEDILVDYASKTVTIDPHPCTGIPTASFHPCKHSEVMKKVAENWTNRGLTLSPDLSLCILLKFISSVIPTIDYDFTMDVDVFWTARPPEASLPAGND